MIDGVNLGPLRLELEYDAWVVDRREDGTVVSIELILDPR